jgi:perosamine synthetase
LLNKKIIAQHKPVFDKADVKAVQKVIQSGWISEGAETKKLEENFRKFLHCKYAVATTSGTSALFLALAANGIKKGDEVIIPNLTFAATGSAVFMTGAKPVLADIESNTFTISIDSIKKKLSKKTKAIIPVHLNGRAPDMDSLLEISEKYGIKIIEDAAQALGSKYKTKYLSTIGDAGAFSLSPPKIITMGQGGIVTTNNKNTYEKILDLKDQGRHDKSDSHPVVGFNFKITDYQAALGNSQFKKIPARIRKLNKIFQGYRELISKNKNLKIPDIKKEEQLWYFDILIKEKSNLINSLIKNKIHIREFYKPLNEQGAFLTTKNFPISKKISSLGLYLPSHVDLTQNDVESVSSKINHFFNN